ncbi:hybrid sensor histidine kinase/response regulator [Burkholderia sp. L27(2015)]|uniref:PAS domain-containing hybrid sensor histidine kinase/response regulator n=1 Tax=Burkholderia sp. L27(2015) TaxID=1641858 RepID=UPI00131E6F5D|nr:hybrid sensor histidine kinase/response regulator [Burkholderia sp. L27(2015)]
MPDSSFLQGSDSSAGSLLQPDLKPALQAGFEADLEVDPQADRRHLPGRRLRDHLAQTALARACVGIALVDASGRLLDANDAFCNMVGYEPTDLIGTYLDSVIHAADRDGVAHLIESVDAGNIADASGEIRFVRKDGASLWSRTHVSGPARTARTSHTDGLVLIVENIDRLKLAEERLGALVERLEVATDAAGLGVFEWNVEDDTGISENQRMREILGYESGQATLSLAGMIAEIVYPEDAAAFQDALQAALEHPGARFHHVCRIRVGGSGEVSAFKWIEIVGQIRRDPTGGPTRLVGVLTDVTVRKQAEKSLLDADSRKNSFLTMLAHELRNPLAPIKAASLLVQMLAPNPESKIYSAGQMIERQSNHLSNLVGQLLEVTRITTGNIELVREIVELSALLRDAVEPMTLLLDSRNQSFTIDTPVNPIWVYADTLRLTQVFTNLIDNASKYTANGGHIEVRLMALAGSERCEVSVTDNGQGVPPELLPHVFDPFVQGNVSVARTDAGLGIGLSIVQQLVSLHGGGVTVSSPGAGAGSTFVVTLPVSQQSAAAVAPPVTIQSSLADGGRVLIVDDNADAAESLAELLTLAGCQVQTAGNGAEAFQTVRSWKPAVIVLDIGLPDLDGFQITLELRSRREMQDVLIIALSGYGSAEYVERARVVGIDMYLTKPAPMEILITSIQKKLREVSSASRQ